MKVPKKAQTCEQCGIKYFIKRTLFSPYESWNRMAECPIVQPQLGMCMPRQLNLSASLCVFPNDCKSTVLCDLGLQMNLRQVDKAANTECTDNEDQRYTFCITIC